MKEVTSSYTASEVETAVQQYWAAEDVYRKVKTMRAGEKPFFFVDGPPYTTGHIHLGTAWNKILKDSILRYQRMCGRNVIDRAGYDMHGLPIEVRVEHELGFASKKDIEEYGIAAFIEKCKEFALTHKDIMSEQFKALGIWMDFADPYQTVAPEYIEAAWWTLARAYEKGLLERGYRVVNLCPRCETAIADSEVEYWDEEDPSIYVKFPIRGRENEYLVIWTTTPWTLPANVAVAVREEFVYARVSAVKQGREEILWIAEPLVEEVLRKGRYQDYATLGTCSGADMVGIVYESPLAAGVPAQRTVEHRVVAADHVTMENTGMVHIAPGHGWEDYLVGQEMGLAVLCPVDGAGIFTEDAGIFAGSYVRDANDAVLDALGDHLLASGRIVHRYGHCWRCKTPIISISTEQWFITVPAIKEKLLSEIAAVTWYPEWAGSARFHDFVADARDWCVSRQRYWGIPIPIWQCEACSATRVFATFAELNEAAGTELADPHRPYVDSITVPCTCGGTMRRVPDIFDVWFDSAVASWATLRFPGKQEAFDSLWPADFITEGQDQTRGWFYSQLGASVIAFDRAPYKSVLMHGFALDAEGRKMSKSFGNVVAPEEVVAQYGVDVLRLYILSASAPWDDLKFNWEGLKTVNRAVNILWNVYRFPLPYMILDGFAPETAADGTWNDEYVRSHLAAMPDEDRWIISRLHSLAAAVTADIGGYQLHRATRALLACILEDISRWYVQLVRPRMWLEEDAVEKRHAYETMYSVMRMLVRLMAPFAPHIAEEIYRNLRTDADPESVHMLSWSAGEAAFVDAALEERMRIVQSFDEAVANARQAGKRKLRWPVAETVVVTGDDLVAGAVASLNDLCANRANSHAVRVVRGRWDRIGWKAEPVMRAIGPKFGKQGPVVKKLIEEADGNAVKQQIDTGGQAVIGTGGAAVTVTAEMVTFAESLPETIFSAPMPGATVYVDVALTRELESEGYAREVIRRIQEMRRQLDLRVEDFITVAVYIADETVRGLLAGAGEEMIKDEVRAVSLALAGSSDEVEGACVRDWDVEGIAMTIAISAAPRQ